MTEIKEKSTSKKLSTVGRAFRSRNYRLYFFGQGVSLIGTWMQNVALSWLVYRLTGSAFMLGVIGFITQTPMMILTPLTGVLADRWNRYRVMIATQVSMMILALALAILVLTHWIAMWQIIVIGLGFGVANALDAPTRHSFIVQLVDNREDISNAIALNSAMFNSARLIGPSVAGLLIAWLGEGACFLFNAFSFLAVIFALLAMRITAQDMIPTAQKSIFRELKEGFLYTFRSKPIRLTLLHFAFVALLGMSFTVLLPILATEILHGDARSLGFLLGALGVGALLGSILMAARKDNAGLWKITAMSSTIFGLGLIALSMSRSLIISLFLMVITGFGMVTIMTASNTFLQTNIEDGKRARVMAFYLLAFFGTVPVGNLITGSIGDIIGVPTTILLAGIFSLVVSLVFTLKFSNCTKQSPPVCR
ncbi:MAG TPA: MFS transporter [Candidatus Deferrimicrobium sp.]|nr:MFS transporter [Candidatus Deferrimicrobium sp.]